MSLVLLAPAGLLASIALALPLLLHLQRASDTQRVDFAALRWLRARLRPRRRLRLREWMLLALRLLLVALVALLFAPPRGRPAAAARPRIYVAPGVSLTDARAAVRELGEDAEWRRLAPGLPEIAAARAVDLPKPASRSRDADRGPALSSLLREADARTPPGARLVVLVPPLLRGLDSERPRLAHAVDWRVLPGEAPSAPTDALDARPPRLVVRYANAQPPESLRFLRAAAASWAGPGAATTTIDSAPTTVAPVGGAWLAWLGPGEMPASLQLWVSRGGTALLVPAIQAPPDVAGAVAWRREDGVVLARAVRLGRGRVLRLAMPLSAGALPELLEPGFPRQLQRLFAGLPAPPRLAPAAALRPRTGGPRFPSAPDALAPWLALAAALVFLCERLLATRARREAGG
jgi:hypothetical protein